MRLTAHDRLTDCTDHRRGIGYDTAAQNMAAVTRELESGVTKRQALVHKYSDVSRTAPSDGASRAAAVTAASRSRNNPRASLHGGRGAAADAWMRAVGGTRSPPPPLPSPALPGEGEGIEGEGESGSVEEGEGGGGDVLDGNVGGGEVEALLPLTADDGGVVEDADGFDVSRVDPWARDSSVAHGDW